MTWARQILSFYQSLNFPTSLPKGIEVMNPFQDSSTMEVCEKFYHKFYNDTQPRKIILGINPGRFGGGTTGIPFTDPIKLEQYCHIPNALPKKAELSSDFIYTMIASNGGPQSFYKRFFISAVCPLGFTLDGKNLNYYDSKELEKIARKFIIETLQAQLRFPIDVSIAYCLGEGQNYKYLLRLNAEYSFFKKIIPLPHPRFILQYRRKKIPEYIKMYTEKLCES